MKIECRTATPIKNRNILQRLYDAISEFIKSVTEKFKGRKAEQNRAAQETFGTDMEQLRHAKNLLKQALRDSADMVESFKANGRAETKGEGGEKRFSIEKIDGTDMSYVKADEQVIVNTALEKVSIRKVKWRTFADRKVSGGSDTNTISTQWAHNEEVLSGDQTVVFHKNECYIIEKYGDLEQEYQIVGRINYKDYKKHRLELEQNGKRDEKLAVILSERNRQRNSFKGRGQSVNIDATEHGRKSESVQRLVEHEDSGRTTKSDFLRGDARNSSDRKNTPVENSNNRNSLKMEDVLRQNETLAKAYIAVSSELQKLKMSKGKYKKGAIKNHRDFYRSFVMY